MKTLKTKRSVIAIAIMVLIAGRMAAHDGSGDFSSEVSSNTIGSYIIVALVSLSLLFYYVKGLIERNNSSKNPYRHLNKLHRKHNRNTWRRNAYKKECHIVKLHKNNLW